MTDSETLWGRPANWLAGVPAVGFAGIAGILTLYGVFVLPERLPDSYANVLERSQVRYATLVAEPSLDFDALNYVSGDLNVIYQRLVAMERDPERFWQWAVFSEKHANFLGDRLDLKRGSLSDERVARISQQVAKFRSRAQQTYKYLSEGNSQLRDVAFMHVISDQHKSRVSGSGVGQTSPMLERLDMVTASGSRLAGSALTDAKILYAELLLDSCWYSESPRSTAHRHLVPDQEILLQAAGKAEEFGLLYATSSIRSIVFRRLIGVFSDSEARKADRATKEIGSEEIPSFSAGAGWQDRLGEVVLGAIEGDWNDVGFLLGRKNSDNPLAVRNGLARWICRLATSDLARRNEAWREKYPVGLQLVSQIAPQLPEFNELLWTLAEERAGKVSDEERRVAAELVAEVVAGQSLTIRHAVLSISNYLRDKPDVSRSHLQLCKRSGGSLMLVSQTLLWYVNATPGNTVELSGFATVITELEPESGFNWFVLGVLEKRAGELSRSKVALQKSLSLLGDIPAIEELLSGVNAELKRQSREAE